MRIALSTTHGPFELTVRLVRRRGIRHLKISVDLYNEVVLNVPAQVPDRFALKFLQEQADWIWERVARCPGFPTLSEYLAQRPIVSGNGRKWEVDVWGNGRLSCDILEAAGRIRLNHIDTEAIDGQLVAGLRAFAQHIIPVRVGKLAQSVDVEFKKLLIRDQRSRWGSCSERGTLSFNWRLVMLPVAMHDYIIWHELAHLTHLNHSPAFWRLLATYDPDYKQHDAGISEWSSLLMRIGRGAPRVRAGVIKVDA